MIFKKKQEPLKGLREKLTHYVDDGISLIMQNKVSKNLIDLFQKLSATEGVPADQLRLIITNPNSGCWINLFTKGKPAKELSTSYLVHSLAGDLALIGNMEGQLTRKISAFINSISDQHKIPTDQIQLHISSSINSIQVDLFRNWDYELELSVSELIKVFRS
jgi:hypothetical protein